MATTWEFRIRAVSENGDPAASWDVTVDFGFSYGTASGETDHEGWADLAIEVGDNREFPLIAQHIWLSGPLPMGATLLGEDVPIEDGDELSFTVSDEGWEEL